MYFRVVRVDVALVVNNYITIKKIFESDWLSARPSFYEI